VKNLGLKLFSFVVAIFLSLFVNSENNSSVMGFVVPIEIRNVPFGKTILLQSNTQVQVSVKGPSFLISQVVSARPSFKIKIPPDVKNKFTASLNHSDLALPPYVQVLSIEPTDIDLTFDDIVQRELPVVVPKIGSLKGSLSLEDTQIQPSSVVITGPATELKDITSIETYPVDLRQIAGDYQADLQLRMPSRMSEMSHKQVAVKFTVSTKQSERRFPDLKVEVRATNPALRSISPDKVSVELTGPIDLMRNIKPNQVLPYVRLGDALDSEENVQVQVDVPDGISVVYIDPVKVKVIK
jgi:YbbR domain-containing protein